MSRQASWPPKVVLHKRSGQARVYLGGKYHYLGEFGSAEAARRYADLLTQATAPPPATPPELHPLAPVRTVAEALEVWLRRDWEVRYRTTKEGNHYKQVVKVVLGVSASQRIDRFGVADLERIRERMIGLGWSARVIGRQITRVRTIWRWLERQGLAPRGSWEHLRTLGAIPPNDRRVKRHAKRCGVTEETYLAVSARCRPKVRDMLAILWHTGMRPSEMCRMRIEEIDRGGPVWWYRPSAHKNSWRGQTREVPLGPTCQGILLPYIQRLRTGYLFRPGGRSKVQWYSCESFSQAVRRAAKRAGVEMTPYQIRHSVKDRLTRQHGLDTARAVLGQQSLTTTNSYGSILDRETMSRVAS